jgi:hypothetical protein
MESKGSYGLLADLQMTTSSCSEVDVGGGGPLQYKCTNAPLETTRRNNVSVLDFIVHYLLHYHGGWGGLERLCVNVT